MRITSFVRVATLLVCASMAATAGGSIYSRYAIGDLLSFSGTRSYALGGASIALLGGDFINLRNPAGMAAIPFTRFAGSFEFTNISSTAAEGSSRYGAGEFQGASMAIPIDTAEGIVLSLSATPYSVVRYSVSRHDTSMLATSDQEYFGSGGLSTLSMGLSVSVLPDLHLGGSAAYYFGRTRQFASVTFLESSLTGVTVDRSTYYSGFGFTGGLIWEHVGTRLGISALRDLTLGAIITTGTSLETDDQVTYTQPDSTTSAPGSFDLPGSFGIGAAYRSSARSLITGEVRVQNWSSARRNHAGVPDLRNALHFAVGYEMAGRPDMESYWPRVSVRAGAYYQSGYLRLNGSDISEYGLTAGVGLPIGPESKLDLGVQVGRRGTTTSGLQQDTFVRVSVGVSASEVWFMQFQED